MRFDDVLKRTWEALSSCEPLMQSCDAITIIRDLQGRITVYLECTNRSSLGDTLLETVREILMSRLDVYFSGDLWVSDPRDDVFASLEDVIHSERIPLQWALRHEDHEASGGSQPEFYVLERRVAKEYWNERVDSESTLPWPVCDVDARKRPAVVTFYSFKGGLGRTTSLAGVSLVLARLGFHVAMIDLDLEAPGLATLFFKDTGSQTGVVDYLIEKPLHQDDYTVRENVLTVADPVLVAGGNPIRLLPAGSVNQNYLEKLARLDFQHQTSTQIQQTLKRLLIEISDTYRSLDFIFLDSRAGFHDLGGLAVTRMSHAVVMLGNHSRQTWAGLTSVIDTLSGHGVREPVPVVLVHAMAPGPTHPNASVEQRLFRETAYDVFQKHYYADQGDISVPNENDPDAPFHPVVIPWHEILRGDIHLSHVSDDERRRTEALVRVLTGEPYDDLARRLALLFGRDFPAGGGGKDHVG
ncbi:KGGVGR-motif variant AAA ATPase [Alicyclobacillus macrosporangiidus]|uniref:tyrosine-protein kinase family protein n=1 Tax=Alicyclobacillus macrosporangiidus TaxID=392015 RepID=UPI001FEBDE8D|nr:hypothetical protein [Alicyclobacillus macrosporangiidus]